MEFYVSYEASCASLFPVPAWENLSAPFWPLPSADLLRHRFQQLKSLHRDVDRFGGIDRVDQFFASLLLDMVIQTALPLAGTRDDRMERLEAARRWLESNLATSQDLAEVARRYGMSQRSFCRHWQEQYGTSPIAYLGEVRIRHACRLLSTTSLPIHDIALQTGFADPFYLTRRFHAAIGMAPTEFRASQGMGA